MIFVSCTENNALPFIIRVKQQLQQGLRAIGNYAPLVVMRVERQVDHGLCFYGDHA